AFDARADEATAAGEELLARHPDFVPIYTFLYELFIRTGHFDRAEEILKKRIRNVPDDGSGRVQLALTYYITGRRDDMTAVLNSLRNDRRKLRGVDGLIGEFYGLIGELDSAVESF